MRCGLSTSIRTPGTGPEEIAARCERLGPELLALDAGLGPDLYNPLARRLLLDTEERPIRVVFAPCPAPRLGPGKRAPALAALDKEERLAAVRLVQDTLARARNLAASVVVLPCPGRVSMPNRRALLVQWLAWGFLEPEGPAVEMLRELRAQRAQAAPAHVDGLRFSLERLAIEAERRGLRLGLPNAAHYDELPTRDEALTLLAELAGAPVGLWLDTAAAHAKEVLGLGSQLAFVRALRAATPAPPILGVSLTDAAGLLGGLPPGVGEIDFAGIAAQLAPDTLAIVACHPEATDDEVGRALALAQQLTPTAPTPPPTPASSLS